jgi:hypothetical protein
MDITIKQGKTFTLVVRYAAEPAVFKAITAITQAAPAQVTATAHGMPDGWPAAIVGITKGMVEINSEADPPRGGDYLPATVLDVNTITFADIDSSSFTAYKSGGYVRYYTPVDLTGAVVAMTVRDRVGGTSLLALLSPGDIAIDNTAKTITITASAAATALLTFDSAVYEVDITVAGVVTELLRGCVTLEKGIV